MKKGHKLSKKRSSKFMQVVTERWVEVFSENQRLKAEIAKLKTK
jgi:hypothetical protein